MLTCWGGGRLCPSILVLYILLYVCVGVKIGGKVYDHKTAKFGLQPGDHDYVRTAPSAIAVPIKACVPIEADLTGKIALIERGGEECYFVDKTYRAVEKGAVGVIIGAEKPETKLLTMFAKDNTHPDIKIPAIFVEYNTFQVLAQLEGNNVTMSQEGEQESFYDPLHWEFAKNFLVLLPIIFIVACCTYFVLKYIKRAVGFLRRTENTRRLPTISYNPGDIHNINCCICIEDFEPNETTKVLPCGHGYHPACIDEWLTEHSDLCPMCKRSIFSEPTHPLSTPRGRCERCFNCCPSNLFRSTTPSTNYSSESESLLFGGWGPRLLSSPETNAVQAV